MGNGKLLLKITSSIFIIFGVIAAIVAFIALIYPTGSGTGWLTGTILVLLASIFEMVIGFIGLKKSDDASQANFFIVTGFVIAVLELVSMILNISAWNIIGFLLPVLYIAGGYLLRSTGIRHHYT